MFAALNIKLYFIKKLFFLSSILFLFINFVDIKKNKNLSEINFPKNSSVVFPYLQKNFIGFKEVLAFKESQGKYNVINTLGYLGKYQFGINYSNLE